MNTTLKNCGIIMPQNTINCGVTGQICNNLSAADRLNAEQVKEAIKFVRKIPMDEWITKLMESTGLTIPEISAKLGVDESTFKHFKKKITDVSDYTLIAFLCFVRPHSIICRKILDARGKPDLAVILADLFCKKQELTVDYVYEYCAMCDEKCDVRRSGNKEKKTDK